jgi:hypothetical protein
LARHKKKSKIMLSTKYVLRKLNFNGLNEEKRRKKYLD